MPSTAEQPSGDDQQAGQQPDNQRPAGQKSAGEKPAGQERAATSRRRGRATRTLLEEAALALIPEVGWGAVTTRMVAERARVNPALVHYHFRSVQDLLTDAVLRSFGALLEAPLDQLTGSEDVEGGIDRLLAVVQPYDGSDPTSLLFTEAVLAANRDDRLRRGLGEFVAEFRRRIGEWLRSRGHEDGAAAATVLAGALDGLILHRSLDPSLDLAACGEMLKKLCAPARREGRGERGKTANGGAS